MCSGRHAPRFSPARPRLREPLTWPLCAIATTSQTPSLRRRRNWPIESRTCSRAAPRSSGERSPRPATGLLISLYFLTPATYADEFLRKARHIRPPSAAKLLLSGPWPPYNFVASVDDYMECAPWNQLRYGTLSYPQGTPYLHETFISSFGRFCRTAWPLACSLHFEVEHNVRPIYGRGKPERRTNNGKSSKVHGF